VAASDSTRDTAKLQRASHVNRMVLQPNVAGRAAPTSKTRTKGKCWSIVTACPKPKAGLRDGTRSRELPCLRRNSSIQ